MARRKEKDLSHDERLKKQKKQNRSFQWVPPDRYEDSHFGHIFNKEDLTNVYMTCSCGWNFQGDWDELTVKWNNHIDFGYGFPGHLLSRKKEARRQKDQRRLSKMFKQELREQASIMPLVSTNNPKGPWIPNFKNTKKRK